jgi:hypothetical protein
VAQINEIGGSEILQRYFTKKDNCLPNPSQHRNEAKASLETSSTPDGLVRCHPRPSLAAAQVTCEAYLVLHHLENYSLARLLMSTGRRVNAMIPSAAQRDPDSDESINVHAMTTFSSIFITMLQSYNNYKGA